MTRLQLGFGSAIAIVVMGCSSKSPTAANEVGGSNSGNAAGGGALMGGAGGISGVPGSGAGGLGGLPGGGAGGSAARGIGGASGGGVPGVGGAGNGDLAGSAGTIIVTNPSANVKLTEQAQVIDGFGVSTAWLSTPDASIKANVYDALFSMTKGAGLSLIRNRIPFRENPNNGLDDKFIAKNADGTYQYTANPDGSKTFALDWSNWDLSGTRSLISDIKAAGADYQVTRFMSTPWTPPNNAVSKWKLSDSNHTIDYTNAPEVGGTLDPNRYSDYADLLADYALGYKAHMGVDLSVLALQNEPNFQCSYESADWSAAQLHSFFSALHGEFTKKGVFTQLPNLQILAPEYQNVVDTLVAPILADSETSTLLGVVGVHQYEFGPTNLASYTPNVLTTALAAGKRLWMTEWSTAAWANDNTITDALILAKLVHQDFTSASFSAFNYWWAWGTGNGALVVTDGTTLTVPKRLYALGQFSRFVRPGWHRVTTSANPAANVYLSAFEDPAGAHVAIVAINAGAATAAIPLSVDAGSLGTISAYRTSASENLANVGMLTGGSSVSVSLAASSVTTFLAAVNN